jgi:hypothetical protein
MAISLAASTFLLVMLGVPAVFARSGGHTGTLGFHGTSDFPAPQTRPPVVQPQSRKSCYRRRLRQLLKLGHDYDLAQEEALLICG